MKRPRLIDFMEQSTFRFKLYKCNTKSDSKRWKNLGLAVTNSFIPKTTPPWKVGTSMKCFHFITLLHSPFSTLRHCSGSGRKCRDIVGGPREIMRYVIRGFVFLWRSALLQRPVSISTKRSPWHELCCLNVQIIPIPYFPPILFSIFIETYNSICPYKSTNMPIPRYFYATVILSQRFETGFAALIEVGKWCLLKFYILTVRVIQKGRTFFHTQVFSRSSYFLWPMYCNC